MKQFVLIIASVCTCLGLMAGTPRLNNANVKMVQGNPHLTKNMKSFPCKPQRLCQNADFYTFDGKYESLTDFFSKQGKTPNDNKLLKQAPRRLSADLLVGDKINFMLAYSYDWDNDEIVPDNIFYYGGWDAYVWQESEGLYCADGMYYNIPLNIYVNEGTGDAELEMGVLGAWQWSDSTTSGRIKTVEDTIQYLIIADENYMMGMSDDFTNVPGTAYEDGSMNFPEGYCYYSILFCTKTVTNRVGNTSVTRDTVETMTPFFRDTWLITPNAYQTCTYTGGDFEYANDAYACQFDDSTVMVMNLYGLGYQGNYFYIRPDGSAVFPTFQYGGDMYSQREDLEASYPEYDWTEADHVRLLGYDESTGYPDYEMMAIDGNVTDTQLSWGSTCWTWWGEEQTQGYWASVSTNPFIDNVLTLTDGSQFIYEKTAQPQIGYDIFTDFVEVMASGDGVVALAILDDDGDYCQVDNPYQISRTDEEQTYTFVAVAQEAGKWPSDLAHAVITVPAMEVSLPGDANTDGMVNLSDIMVLIDALLNDSYDGINLDNADVNHDGTIDLQDLIVLIDMILNAR